MSEIAKIAREFFHACETGGGWEECKAFCAWDASFSAQAEPVADLDTVQAYADWMKGLLTFMPDGRYDLKAFAIDEETKTVTAYAVFHATHTGEGGPCPPTGKSTSADYVYVMVFDGNHIAHLTKIWNAGWTMRELGWA